MWNYARSRREAGINRNTVDQHTPIANLPISGPVQRESIEEGSGIDPQRREGFPLARPPRR